MRAATVLLLLCTACVDRGEAPPRSALPRVVSLHDVTTEMVVALGAADRLVGIDDPVDLDAGARDAISAVPRVAGLESILSVHPDVVLGLGVVAERDPELVARLRQKGIVVALADPATLEDVYSLTRLTAERVGAVAAGEKLIQRLRSQAGEHAPATGRPPRVFVYDCCDPPFTAGGKTVLTDLIARAGGTNIFADLDADWTHVSWEEVVTRRPELVVIHAYRYEGQGDASDKEKTLRAMSSLAGVPVVVLPLGESLGGLRSLDGLARLRAAIRKRP